MAKKISSAKGQMEKMTIILATEMRVTLDAYSSFYDKSRPAVVNEALESFFKAQKEPPELRAFIEQVIKIQSTPQK